MQAFAEESLFKIFSFIQFNHGLLNIFIVSQLQSAISEALSLENIQTSSYLQLLFHSLLRHHEENNCIAE